MQSPKEIAEKGERIYDERYRKEYEGKHNGRFVVVEIGSEETLIGDVAEDVFEEARQKFPEGVFHLIKVGAAGAYRVTYSSSAALDWVFQ